jgi:hypothetical protein
MPRLLDDVARVVCPYCREKVELFVDPDTSGSFVEDCAVCCRPWLVQVTAEPDGSRRVEVAAAQ